MIFHGDLDARIGGAAFVGLEQFHGVINARLNAAFRGAVAPRAENHPKRRRTEGL